MIKAILAGTITLIFTAATISAFPAVAASMITGAAVLAVVK